MSVLGQDNVRSLMEFRQRQADRGVQPSPSRRLPVVLGAISVERQHCIERDALLRAAAEAEFQAQSGVSIWLEAYAKSLSTP